MARTAVLGGIRMKLGNYTSNPPGLLLELAAMAEQSGNERARRVYMANYLRLTDERRR